VWLCVMSRNRGARLQPGRPCPLFLSSLGRASDRGISHAVLSIVVSLDEDETAKVVEHPVVFQCVIHDG
jgi:hypothetical protein